MPFTKGYTPWNKGKQGVMPVPMNKGTGGRCKVADCDGLIAGQGLCGKHYSRKRRHGDPNIVKRNGYKGDDITYRQAHNRVKDLHGAAAQYPCATCEQQAIDWAYDHRDPAVKYDVDRRPFSVNVEHYIPLCRRCHRRLDSGVRHLK